MESTGVGRVKVTEKKFNVPRRVIKIVMREGREIIGIKGWEGVPETWKVSEVKVT